MQLGDVGAGLCQQRPQAAALLVQQGQQHVRRLDHLVIAAHGQGLGVGQGGLETAGQFVVAHGGILGSLCTGFKAAAS